VVAHENVLKRMSSQAAGRPALPEAAWPTSTYFVPEKDLHHNGEAILVLYQPAAHTDGDSAVYFRSSEVLVAGDLFDLSRYPVVDTARGGTAVGVINALNRLLDLAVAGNYEEGGTMVIPGHGHISDEADLVEYRDMATIIRDRVQDMVKKGRTLTQVKEAKPTMEYDGIYGSPDAFLEALFRDLTAPAPAVVKRKAK
jgi:glyoxylase-like metal-dependent hydrolase (beta-lactamase superfamily II)